MIAVADAVDRILVPIPTEEEGPVGVSAEVDLDVPGAVFAGPLRVSIEAALLGRVLRLTGRIEGAVRAECDRCLAGVEVALRERFVSEYDIERGRVAAVDLGVDDAGATITRVESSALGIEGGGGREVVDATEEVRMRVAQAVPDRVLCRPDCLGLCPTCGADRNAGRCACPATAPVSGPFAGLAALISGGLDGEGRGGGRR